MNYIIFDLEATCWEDKELHKDENEIIEIGAVKVNSKLEIVDEFSVFVKPTLNPILSDFCKKLTTIEQSQVDNAKRFNVIKNEFQDWCSSSGQSPYWLCSWGKYDKNQLIKDCKRHNIGTNWLNNHISIKHQHGQMLANESELAMKQNGDSTKNIERAILRIVNGVGMDRALSMFDLKLEGTHHRGIDDARNIAKIFIKLFKDLNFKN